jgi:hypothetical protein
MPEKKPEPFSQVYCTACDWFDPERRWSEDLAETLASREKCPRCGAMRLEVTSPEVRFRKANEVIVRVMNWFCFEKEIDPSNFSAMRRLYPAAFDQLDELMDLTEAAAVKFREGEITFKEFQQPLAAYYDAFWMVAAEFKKEPPTWALKTKKSL